MSVFGSVLLLASCGDATQESGVTADQHASSVGSTSPSSPSTSTYVAPIKTMGPGGLRDARPTRLDLPAFEQAMAAYCTDYYTSQREAEKLLEPNPQARIDYARATAAYARRTERQLTALTPPKKLDDAFTEFLDSTHRITVARAGMLASLRSSGQEGMAADDLDHALTERWALATRLHAPLCDNKLPSSQADAVVAAAREWATSTDPEFACRDLVTPSFRLDESFCVHVRTNENTPPYSLPDDIGVLSIAGVEGLTATVDYLKIGGCGCEPEAFVRLFFVAGRWLVNDGDLESGSSLPR